MQHRGTIISYRRAVTAVVHSRQQYYLDLLRSTAVLRSIPRIQVNWSASWISGSSLSFFFGSRKLGITDSRDEALYKKCEGLERTKVSRERAREGNKERGREGGERETLERTQSDTYHMYGVYDTAAVYLPFPLHPILGRPPIHTLSSWCTLSLQLSFAPV